MTGKRGHPKDIKDPRRLKDRKMRHARWDRLMGHVALVDAGVDEMKRWRKDGHIPLDVYIEILEKGLDDVREEVEAKR